MKATEILIEEHEVIMRVLVAMVKAVKAIDAGNENPGFFLEAADFIKGFADGCHHAKEEGALFPAMEAGGIPVQGGPIGMMLAEHAQARVYTRLMRDAAEKWQRGDPSASRDVISNAVEYVRMLRMHIQKENNILFPMADRAIPLEKQHVLWDEFERIDKEELGEGIRERYEALAEKLEHMSLKY